LTIWLENAHRPFNNGRSENVFDRINHINQSFVDGLVPTGELDGATMERLVGPQQSSRRRDGLDLDHEIRAIQL
jgi:hypothetical protein